MKMESSRTSPKAGTRTTDADILRSQNGMMRRSRLKRRRTKIVCTIGPATGSTNMIERLIRAGMDVARLNLAHGTEGEHARYVRAIRDLSRRLRTNIAILMDLPGPKYRTGRLQGGKAVLKKGAELVFTTRQIEGDATKVSVNLPSLPKDIKPGDTILIADGEMQARALKVEADEVTSRVTVGGVLTEERGLVVPGMRMAGPFITDKLRKDLAFALSQKPDYLALSFVTEAEDVAGVRKLVTEESAAVPIIAKIERGEAVKNLDRIIAGADGIMVARGDLGVEIPLEKVPLVQKEIIGKCNQAGKPVITATEMLLSMVKSMRPTRAEASDVTNSIFDGTDATMLSEETSVGNNPLQAVVIMDKIAREAERKLPYEIALTEKKIWFEQRTEELISYNACVTAHSLGARAIVAFTESGSTAARVSKYRPRMPIVAITPEEAICRRLVLHWGVQPVPIAMPSSVADLFATASGITKELGLAKPGDLVVITGGIPLGVGGSTNLLKVEVVS
jgi:pyruvate kinase